MKQPRNASNTPSAPPPSNTNFDEFAGAWTTAEAAEFDAALEQMRRIDPDDWRP